MGGGLMQLVAYGAQDVYLSGNPQITFFKVVYRRHTNFSCEPIQQVWNGAADFGRTVTCNINRNGDLISNMYVAVLLNEVTPDGVEWGMVSRVGHAMIDSCKVEIGGSKLDEQYGDWLNIWYELTHKTGQEVGYANMIGDVENLTKVNGETKRSHQLYVPLQFWFNRNNGLALPLIALQYHDVRVTVQLRAAADLVNYKGTTAPSPSDLPSMADCYLLIDYIYLDSEERKRFAQASHEYLIEQLQFTGSESLTGSNNKYRLNFNHPCKYLVWAPQLERHITRNQWLATADDGDWEAARERAAKLAWVAVRLVNATDVNTSASASSEGLSDATPAAITGCELNTVAAKVDARIISQDSANQTVNLDDIIVLRNDLTSEDMSKTVTELLDGAAGLAVSHVTTFLVNNGVNVIDYHNYGNFVDRTDNPVCEAKLQLNGHDRFQERDGNYFNFVQPHQHFSRTPAAGVNVYSFALKAEDHQPTGTCNFSRIDNATLQVRCGLYNTVGDSNYISTYIGGSSSNSNLNIYTMNYNVLRVMSGMAGAAYSN